MLGRFFELDSKHPHNVHAPRLSREAVTVAVGVSCVAHGNADNG